MHTHAHKYTQTCIHIALTHDIHTQISTACIFTVTDDGHTLSVRETSPYDEPGVCTYGHTSSTHTIMY